MVATTRVADGIKDERYNKVVSKSRKLQSNFCDSALDATSLHLVAGIYTIGNPNILRVREEAFIRFWSDSNRLSCGPSCDLSFLSYLPCGHRRRGLSYRHNVLGVGKVWLLPIYLRISFSFRKCACRRRSSHKHTLQWCSTYVCRQSCLGRLYPCTIHRKSSYISGNDNVSCIRSRRVRRVCLSCRRSLSYRGSQVCKLWHLPICLRTPSCDHRSKSWSRYARKRFHRWCMTSCDKGACPRVS
ncbi:Hypothetical protein HVR_LOCUS1217 [uncultured virus]|nr:Hypothetical protein HVR_LOCUS1217 [uncultured virus]